MYESQQWLPVPSLFGLVGCPIPRELKAEVNGVTYSKVYSHYSFLRQVLLTLAAFAKSPDIATSMIHTLESVQVGVISEEIAVFSFSLEFPMFQVLNTVSGVGVAVGGALVQPQANEGSIQVFFY